MGCFMRILNKIPTSKGAVIALVCYVLIELALLSSVIVESKHAPESSNKVYFAPQDFASPLPTCTPNTPTPTPTPTPTVLNKINADDFTITGYTLELTPLGTYFITAYCPYECGFNGENYPTGWQTASGAICHRSSWQMRLIEPTTCAVDPNLHYINADGWGDMFYIEEFDRVFIAEDTGGAVKGKHLDLFYEDYEDVVSFPTGYYTVYAVDIIEYKTRAGDYDGIEYVYN